MALKQHIYTLYQISIITTGTNSTLKNNESWQISGSLHMDGHLVICKFTLLPKKIKEIANAKNITKVEALNAFCADVISFLFPPQRIWPKSLLADAKINSRKYSKAI